MSTTPIDLNDRITKPEMFKPATHTLEKAGAVRWKGAVLQQQWEIQTFLGESQSSARWEWRDVPVER